MMQDEEFCQRVIASVQPGRAAGDVRTVDQDAVGLSWPRRCHNPLKTGLGTARMELRLGIDYTGESLSQSPENGSRHCKLEIRELEIREIVVPGRRNPLKTGLGTASGGDRRIDPRRSWGVAIP